MTTRIVIEIESAGDDLQSSEGALDGVLKDFARRGALAGAEREFWWTHSVGPTGQKARATLRVEGAALTVRAK